MAAGNELTRRLDDSLIAGVCAGVAAYLDVETVLVRAVFVGLGVLSGVGLVLYPIAWALLPAAGERPASLRARAQRFMEAGVVALLTAVALYSLRRSGVWLGDVVVLPLLVGSLGVALILRQALNEETVARPRWALPWRRWPAGMLGMLLLLGAGLLFLRDAGVFSDRVAPVGTTSTAVLVIALLLGPFLYSLARRLSLERAERIRTEERAEMAAHLHDSVLQTLALIQRRADDPAQVMGLARRQERELRDWLHDGKRSGEDAHTLRAAIEAAASAVEADHAVRIETVIVGDCVLDEPLRAMVAAAREALVNAAKFAGVAQIDIYVEATPQRVELFVRDRGAGFDPDHVPADRHGIRRSIRERMERHGGAAIVRAAPGHGTEVELSLVREAA
jgi:signal transduction histidine kinase